jgi:hypothetical protein
LKKGTILTISLLLFFLFCYSQTDINSILKLDTIYCVEETEKPSVNDLVYYVNDDLFYFINYNSRKADDILVLNEINLKSGYKTRYYGIFDLYEHKNSIFKDYEIVFSSMYVKDSLLYFIAFDKLYSYIISNEEIEFYQKVNIKLSNINCIKNKIVLYHNYNFHKNNKTEPTVLSIFNEEKFTIGKTITPKFENLCYTHFNPNNWFDFSSNSISFCQTVDYKIDFYDSNLKKINQIIRNIDNWEKAPKKKKDQSAHDCLDYYNPWEDKIARLLGGYFINDTAFITQYKLPQVEENDFKYFFDIWSFNGNKWELSFSNLCNSFKFKIDKDTILTNENFPFNSMTYPKYIVHNNRIISFRVEPYINPIGLTKGEYDEKQNSYLLDSDVPKRLQLFVFDIIAEK